MEKLSPQMVAGRTLRRLIQENYPSQEEFAYDYGIEIRTVSRYVNNGINKLDAIQELANFFDVSVLDFLKEEDK